MKKYSLYGLVSAFGIYIRVFVLPNPFECFGDKAWLINLFAEPIIQTVAYLLVGAVYRAGSAPVIGSLLFLGTYSIIVFTLRILGKHHFALWWTVILFCIFVAVVIVTRWIVRKVFKEF